MTSSIPVHRRPKAGKNRSEELNEKSYSKEDRSEGSLELTCSFYTPQTTQTTENWLKKWKIPYLKVIFDENKIPSFSDLYGNPLHELLKKKKFGVSTSKGTDVKEHRQPIERSVPKKRRKLNSSPSKSDGDAPQIGPVDVKFKEDFSFMKNEIFKIKQDCLQQRQGYEEKIMMLETNCTEHTRKIEEQGEEISKLKTIVVEQRREQERHIHHQEGEITELKASCLEQKKKILIHEQEIHDMKIQIQIFNQK